MKNDAGTDGEKKRDIKKDVRDLLKSKETEKNESKRIKSFMNQYGEPHVFIRDGKRAYIYSMCGHTMNELGGWIQKEFVKVDQFNNEIVNMNVIRNVINLYAGQCREKEEKIELHTRVCNMNGDIYIDMADLDWNSIKINRDGWDIKQNMIPMFMRYNHQKPIKVSKLDKKCDFNTIDKYLHTFDEDDKHLLKVYIVSCFIPDINHPVLSLYGEGGSAKSTIHSIIKDLIDPSELKLGGLPTDKDLVQTLQHHWFIAFDNLTKIKQSTSDILCTASTGGGQTKRKLYSDDSDIIYSYKRCTGLNGLHPAPKMYDLLNRCITLEIPNFKEGEKIEETKFKNMFEKDYNEIMNGLLDIIPEAIKEADKIEDKTISEFRMSGFAKWGEAISLVMGHNYGEFIKIYKRNIMRTENATVDGNLVGNAITEYMSTESIFSGNATDLCKVLIEFCPEREVHSFPNNFTITRKLKDLIPSLKKRDILVKFVGGRGQITIHKIVKDFE